MIVYEVAFTEHCKDGTKDVFSEWTGTNKKAIQRSVHYGRLGCTPVKIFKHDVPTKKAELLEWLNNNLDN
jgi:hypothetical protein